MKNYFELPCGKLEIDMSNHRMVAIVCDDPYRGDMIQQPVKIYRGCITNYMGEVGRVLWGWVSTPFINDSIVEYMKDGDSVFYIQDHHKIYDLETGNRIF